MAAAKANRLRPDLFLSLLLTTLLAAAGLCSLTDPRQGLRLFGAPLEQRPSYRYLLGSVSAAAGAETESPGDGRDGSQRENGARNVVTAVLLDYRVADALAAALALLAASGATALLADGGGRAARAPVALRRRVRRTALSLCLAGGLACILCGHLVPGGSFAGGAFLALARLGAAPGLSPVRLRTGACLFGLTLMGIGFWGWACRGSFLANFLPAGAPGAFASGGTTPILQILLGFMAALLLASIAADLRG